MRRKLPVLLLALIILLQVFVPPVYAASKNEAISSTLSFCLLDTTPEGAGKAVKNTNPFKGSVTDDVIVVDPAGNAMPIKAGQQIQGRPDSKMWQVKDQYGNPTGDRLDGLGHPKQIDPKAQLPHGHRVDQFGNTILDQFGNPHLPIYPPNW
jgi:hypothetical protein